MKFLRNKHRIGNSDARVPVIFLSRYQWPGATTEPGSRGVDRFVDFGVKGKMTEHNVPKGVVWAGRLSKKLHRNSKIDNRKSGGTPAGPCFQILPI